MSLILFSCQGGHLLVPDRSSLFLSRESGGHLVVLPPQVVWERSELTPGDLGCFAFLVAAAGRAMIDALPQLEGGCINYFDAGNWALNDEAEPKGRKTASAHRKMHQHLIGRSPASTDPSCQWGEAPRFPRFAEQDSWAAGFERLTAAECYQVVSRTDALLRTKYGLLSGQIAAWSPCDVCAYPTPVVSGEARHVCAECRAS